METLLPTQETEQQLKALRQFIQEGEICLAEPCDCGSHIRHNNGGNYHEYLTVKADGGRWWVKNETTCELEPPSRWQEVSFLEALNEIQRFAALGWRFAPRFEWGATGE